MYGTAFTGIGKHVACLISEIATKVNPEDGFTFVIFCHHAHVAEIQALSAIFEVI